MTRTIDRLKTNLKSRPYWMNGLMLFCGYMSFIYLPWDIFLKPLTEDQEVWFGVLFTGWSAKAGALLHWFVYGFGLLGFWKMKPWMFPWASLYTLQIALGMAVWNFQQSQGSPSVSAFLIAIPFTALAIALWRTPFFRNKDQEPQTED